MSKKVWDESKPHLFEVPALAPAMPSIDRVARHHVDTKIAAAGDREARLAITVTLADYFAELEATKRAERDATALAIEAHYNVHRGVALHAAVGVNRTRWCSMRAAATGDPTEYPTTVDPMVLHQLACDTYEARQIATFAREARDGIVRELADEGWTNVQIAELIGRNPSQVSHIKHHDRPRSKPKEAVA